MQNKNIIENIDYKVSLAIYNLFNIKGIKKIPYYLGLLPYELYVLPGMYIAILQAIWFETSNPIQFHLLPHWFAYSIFQFLKITFTRARPGCANRNMSQHIDSSHCSGKHTYQSFPSGHTGVAFSLATALYMEMMHSKNPSFFEIKIINSTTRKAIAGIGLFIASMISIHRISKGYHHFGDVLIGAMIGSVIGYVSWSLLNVYKQKYYNICVDNDKQEDCDEYREDHTTMKQKIKLLIDDLKKNEFSDHIRIKTLGKLFLTIFILILLGKFIIKDIWKLTSIKH